MRLKVTRQDIRQGKKGCADGCPIYLALSRALPEWYFRVRPNFIEAEHNYIMWPRISMSLTMQGWVSDFDNGNKVSPRSFNIPELNAPRR